MRGFAITAMTLLAVAGLSACNRGAANNSAAKNTAAPAAAPAAPAAPAPAAVLTPAEVRASLIQGCEAEARNNPEIASLNLQTACNCAVDGAFGTRPDAAQYATTQEGQAAFTQALAQCVATAGGGAGADDEKEKTE